jgi:hypothetical protein
VFDPVYVDSFTEGMRQSLPYLFVIALAVPFWMAVRWILNRKDDPNE